MGTHQHPVNVGFSNFGYTQSPKQALNFETPTEEMDLGKEQKCVAILHKEGIEIEF